MRQAAVRRGHQALAVDVAEGGLEAGADFLDGLDPTLGDGDDSEDDGSELSVVGDTGFSSFGFFGSSSSGCASTLSICKQLL